MRLSKYFLIFLAAYAFLFCLLYIPRITSDGLEMYASTQSMIITQDLNFTDNFANHAPENPDLQRRPLQALTETGLPFNLHPIGISLMNAPHFLVGHLISMMTGYSLDGYNEVYFTTYTLGTVIYCFFGGWIIFHYLVNYLNYRKTDSMISVLVITAATPMLWYIFLEPSMSHGVTIFTASLFILVWLKFRNENSYRYWIFIGLAAGLLVLIRLQDVYFVLFPLLDFIIYKRKEIKNIFGTGLRFILYFVSVFIVFFPQMIYWKFLNGSFAPNPMPLTQYFLKNPPGSGSYQEIHFFQPFTPHIKEFLFSTNNGLFVYHPIFILCTSGMYFVYKKHKEIIFPLLFILIAAVYMNSATWDWMGGSAFGMRRIAGVIPVFAIGLVAILDRIDNNKKNNILKLSIFIIPSIWNFFFMLQWRVEMYIRTEVDFVNQVIPYFFSKTDSYVLWWQTHMQSAVMKSLNSTTSEFNDVSGLTVTIFIISIPAIILLIFAFNVELKKFIKIKIMK
jgi:hypothetical protein